MMIEPRTKRLTKMMSMRQSRRQKEPENEAVTIPPPPFSSLTKGTRPTSSAGLFRLSRKSTQFQATIPI